MENEESSLRRKFSSVWLLLDERSRRLMAASEALALGYGGVSRIRRASGLSRKAIAKGIREIADGNAAPGRIRRLGAGRKNIVERDPKLLVSLDRLIEPGTRGDPESPLRWICKSTRSLAAQLTRQKHPVSHEKVAQLLRDQNYSLQSNRKTEEGADHPDRDAQFRHISGQVKRALATRMPVIPRSGVKFTCIAKKWLKIEDLSQGCLQQSIDSARHSRSPSAVLACELDAYRKSTRLNSSHRCISYAVFC